MPNLVNQLAESVKQSGVRSVYGEPMSLDGTTVVPVALVWYGFGAGSEGSAGDGDEQTGGYGGGGGSYSVPVGVYVRDDAGVRFQPNVVAVLAVGIPFVWVTGKALARIIKAAKR